MAPAPPCRRWQTACSPEKPVVRGGETLLGQSGAVLGGPIPSPAGPDLRPGGDGPAVFFLYAARGQVSSLSPVRVQQGDRFPACPPCLCSKGTGFQPVPRELPAGRRLRGRPGFALLLRPPLQARLLLLLALPAHRQTFGRCRHRNLPRDYGISTAAARTVVQWPFLSPTADWVMFVVLKISLLIFQICFFSIHDFSGSNSTPMIVASIEAARSSQYSPASSSSCP